MIETPLRCLNLTKAEWLGVRSLAADRSTVIENADKGSSVDMWDMEEMTEVFSLKGWSRFFCWYVEYGRDDRGIVVKKADQGSFVVMWDKVDRVDYVKEAENYFH